MFRKCDTFKVLLKVMYVYKKVVFFFLSFFKKIAFSTGNVHYTSYVMFSDVDIKRSQMEQQLADRKKR